MNHPLIRRMPLAAEYGQLIEFGKLDDATTYELRNTEYPMLYVYRRIDGGWIQNVGQLGNTPVQTLARLLAAELPKKLASKQPDITDDDDDYLAA